MDVTLDSLRRSYSAKSVSAARGAVEKGRAVEQFLNRGAVSRCSALIP
jgi:hypothetical protein